jgi:hypothetical protein
LQGSLSLLLVGTSRLSRAYCSMHLLLSTRRSLFRLGCALGLIEDWKKSTVPETSQTTDSVTKCLEKRFVVPRRVENGPIAEESKYGWALTGKNCPHSVPPFWARMEALRKPYFLMMCWSLACVVVAAVWHNSLRTTV